MGQLEYLDVDNVVKILVPDKRLADDFLAKLPCKRPRLPDLPRWGAKAQRTPRLNPANLRCWRKINTDLCLGKKPLPLLAAVSPESKAAVVAKANADDNHESIIKMRVDVAKGPKSSNKQPKSSSPTSILDKFDDSPERQVVQGPEAVAATTKLASERDQKPFMIDLNALPSLEDDGAIVEAEQVDAAAMRQ